MKWGSLISFGAIACCCFGDVSAGLEFSATSLPSPSATTLNITCSSPAPTAASEPAKDALNNKPDLKATSRSIPNPNAQCSLMHFRGNKALRGTDQVTSLLINKLNSFSRKYEAVAIVSLYSPAILLSDRLRGRGASVRGSIHSGFDFLELLVDHPRQEDTGAYKCEKFFVSGFGKLSSLYKIINVSREDFFPVSHKEEKICSILTSNVSANTKVVKRPKQSLPEQEKRLRNIELSQKSLKNLAYAIQGNLSSKEVEISNIRKAVSDLQLAIAEIQRKASDQKNKQPVGHHVEEGQLSCTTSSQFVTFSRPYTETPRVHVGLIGFKLSISAKGGASHGSAFRLTQPQLTTAVVNADNSGFNVMCEMHGAQEATISWISFGI